MQLLAYSPGKGGLLTIETELKPESTTYFDNARDSGDIHWIADSHEGLLIKTLDYDYPLLLQNLSRESIRYSRGKALELYRREII